MRVTNLQQVRLYDRGMNKFVWLYADNRTATEAPHDQDVKNFIKKLLCENIEDLHKLPTLLINEVWDRLDAKTIDNIAYIVDNTPPQCVLAAIAPNTYNQHTYDMLIKPILYKLRKESEPRLIRFGTYMFTWAEAIDVISALISSPLNLVIDHAKNESNDVAKVSLILDTAGVRIETPLDDKAIDQLIKSIYLPTKDNTK